VKDAEYNPGATGMIRTAIIEGDYRYRLFRKWTNTQLKPLLWVMLNPSTADDKIEDATIRRCIDFSNRWGYGSLFVGNLYAYRATNPYDLVMPDEAESLINTDHLLEMMVLSDRVVCAWGTRGFNYPPWFLGDRLWHLGLTKEGYPKHPLYLSKETTLTKWRR
jgi:hypothetical protein